MRVKNILSIIAFVAAFGISVALAALTADQSQPRFQIVSLQSNDTTRQNIERFLQQDIQNGQSRNSEVYRFEDNSSLSSPNLMKRSLAVSEYAATSGAMDDSRLPQDVQLAWLKHMRAWHNYADFLQKARTQKLDYPEVSQLENQYNREINLTWYEVLRVAGRYGAVVNDY